MDSGLESKELRPSRRVHTHPTPNKEQMTFLRGSWRGPNKLPRFGDLLKWDRGADMGLSAFIVSIRYFKITKQTNQQNQRPVFTLMAH